MAETWSSDTVGFITIGGGLTDSDAANLYSAIYGYMTDVGAVVEPRDGRHRSADDHRRLWRPCMGCRLRHVGQLHQRAGQRFLNFPPGVDTHAQAINALNSGGSYLSYPANVPVRTDLGLQTVPTRTNSIRNNSMVGAVAGTPGTCLQIGRRVLQDLLGV